MNTLPGTAYPEAIGGVVDKPAFVFGLGDITEWPTKAAKDTYEQLITFTFPPQHGAQETRGFHAVSWDKAH